MSSNPIDYTLRVRFRIPAGHRIGVDAAKFVMTLRSGRELVLCSAETGKNIKEAEWLALESSGWESAEAAEAAAIPLMDTLRRSLILHMIAVDLGCRKNIGGGGLAPSVVERMQEAAGEPVQILSQVHGPMVYPTSPSPMFIKFVATGSAVLQAERWKRSFLLAFDCSQPLSERERTAFDLFSASRQVTESADAKFLLLFATFESLLEPEERPKWAVEHVESLIALTRKIDVEDDADQSEKDSLLGTLRWLRNYSIRNAGRKLVRERLAGRTYLGRPAEDLFRACYELRNRLAHGASNYPEHEEVSRLVAGLDHLVADLLAGRLLDHESS